MFAYICICVIQLVTAAFSRLFPPRNTRQRHILLNIQIKGDEANNVFCSRRLLNEKLMSPRPTSGGGHFICDINALIAFSCWYERSVPVLAKVAFDYKNMGPASYRYIMGDLLLSSYALMGNGFYTYVPKPRIKAFTTVSEAFLH